MPRRRNPTPSYRFHKQSGQAVSDFYDPLTGRKRTVSLGKWESTASRLEHARLCAEVAAGRTAPGPTGACVNELLAAFLTHATAYYVKDGKSTDEVWCLKSAIRLVRESHGHVPVDQFGPAALEAVRQRMVDQGWARGTVNKQVGRVRRVFRWGVAKQLVPPGVLVGLEAVAPLRKGRTAARETTPVGPVADADVEATLPHLSAVVAGMVRVQRLTGMRPQEVCRLRPRDLDRSGAVWVYSPAGHKTEHLAGVRRVPIGPRAQAVLAPFLAGDPHAFCFDPRQAVAELRAKQRAARMGRGGGGCRKPGVDRPRRAAREWYSTGSYRQAVRRGCAKAGVPVWEPNQLRHSFATEVRKAHGLEAAQVLLGHARADVTQVYAERNEELAARVAGQVG
ncbi:MAG: tyrosine-type recombinase/integrase [Armatimonadaceae bacterium]